MEQDKLTLKMNVNTIVEFSHLLSPILLQEWGSKFNNQAYKLHTFPLNYHLMDVFVRRSLVNSHI